MKWFFAVNRASPGFPLYAELIAVAVRSARRHAPALEPHLLYDGPDDPLLDRLTTAGVTLHRVRSFLFDELKEIAEQTDRPLALQIGAGAFLRLEIPSLAERSNWPDEVVLYTDCDVMVVGDPLPELQSRTPEYFAVAPERAGDPLNMNSGVMLMNLPGLRSQDESFRAHARQHLEHFTHLTWDQEAYRTFYSTRLLPNLEWDRRIGRFSRPLRRKRWGDLPLALNWRPYWGPNPAASIVHFHGLKPQQSHMIDGPQAEAALQPLRHLATPHYYELCEQWRELLAQA